MFVISSNMPVLDSRDWQGNLWLPYNAAMLAASTRLFAAKLAVKLDSSDTLSKLKIYWKPVYVYALEVVLSN